MMGKGDDGEGGEPAGWRGGKDGGGREYALGKRWVIAGDLAGTRRRSPGTRPWTEAFRQGLPLHSPGGAPAPDPVSRSGSSFPPCPCDFSAPESRSLGKVPPAASSPRGTPRATPLPVCHWLSFTPVTFPLAEGWPDMQIRMGLPPRRLAGACGAEPLDLGSDWSGTGGRRRRWAGLRPERAPRCLARLLPHWQRPGQPLLGPRSASPAVPVGTGRPLGLGVRRGALHRERGPRRPWAGAGAADSYPR